MGSGNVLTLVSTAKLPGFGKKFEVIEAFKGTSSSTGVQDGLMLVNQPNLTPTTSVQSVGCLMGHDSSFHRYGGFCEGAKMILSDEESYS